MPMVGHSPPVSLLPFIHGAIEYPFDTLARLSTPDQLLSVALHGTAMRYAAENATLAESIAELREMANGRNDILAEAAGITAGSWYAWPATHVGQELIAAGMFILAGGGSRSAVGQ